MTDNKKARNGDGPDVFWLKDYPDIKIERDEEFGDIYKTANTLRGTLENLWALGGERTPHYASEVFSCPRKIILRRKGTYPIDEQTFEGMDVGIALEPEVIDKYDAAGKTLPYSKQTHVQIQHPKLKYEIRGRIDLLVLEKNMIIPVEIKTSKSYGFYPDAWLNYKPRREHVAQLMVYLHYLRGFLPPYVGKMVMPPEYGYAHYYNKNDGQHARYRVYYSKDLFADIVKYFALIEDLEKKGLPSIRVASAALDYFREQGIDKDKDSLTDDSYPCRWFNKAKKDEEPIEAGRCEFFGGCWEDKEFLTPGPVDLSSVLDVLIKRQKKGF